MAARENNPSLEEELVNLPHKVPACCLCFNSACLASSSANFFSSSNSAAVFFCTTSLVPQETTCKLKMEYMTRKRYIEGTSKKYTGTIRKHLNSCGCRNPDTR